MGILDSALGFLGPVVGGLIGKSGQEEANSANAAMSQAQMDFQERMRATQYQTAVKDMAAAGLNPMLAYHQGGAGTPSGSMAVAQNPGAHVASGFAQGTSSALDASRTSKELEKKDAEIELLKQQKSIKSPMEVLGPILVDGINAIKGLATKGGEGAAVAVQKVGDALNSVANSAQSLSSGDVVSRGAEIARSLGESAPALGAVQRGVSGVVHSAGDAVDSLKRGVESVGRAWDRGKELSSKETETAREFNKREGRRLGTLGRQPRWAPEYGKGE